MSPTIHVDGLNSTRDEPVNTNYYAELRCNSYGGMDTL